MFEERMREGKLIISSLPFHLVFHSRGITPIAEEADSTGKNKKESLWPILRINHQRSRYVYEMYYQKHEITRPVYEFALRHRYADKALIAKWKKQGYEKLCCLQCISHKNHKFGSVCICRVPKSELGDQPAVECQHCGCTGCSG